MRQGRRFSRHGLSGKLLLLFVVMAVLFVLLVGGSLHHAFRSHFKTNVRPHLVQYLDYVQQDIGIPPDRQRAQTLADRLGIEIQILDAQGTWSSGNRKVVVSEVQTKHRHVEGTKEYFLVEEKGTNAEYLMMRHGDATLLFNVPNVRQEREGVKGYFPLLVLLLMLVVLYHATRRLFRPIETIQDGVKRFGAGELEHRIDVHRRDELGELSKNFNAMADDIQQMLDAKRQLLLAVSHELRTPLTRMNVATELLTDEAQKAQLKNDLNEIQMLIEEIIETERLSTRHRVLNHEAVDLNALVLEIRDSFYKEKPLRVELPDQAVVVDVDVARIKLLLKNLIDNALRYTPSDKPPPMIRVAEQDNRITIEVRDEGEGIEAVNIPRLTEPFYRVDPSRQRETGGYGLGLYLCKMIAEAHGGGLTIESKLDDGTTVRVWLPK